MNTELLLWAWVQSLFQILTQEQKNEFADKLIKNLNTMKTEVKENDL